MLRNLVWPLLLAACTTTEVTRGVFDTPIAVGVLPAGHGPFEDPVGFAANEVGGLIWPLALKQGRFLTDDPSVSFLRATALPTGSARILTAVAAWAPERGRVDVFAGDAAAATLLRIPYVVGYEEGAPVEAPAPTATVAFVDADGSGDAATLANLQLIAGFAATETWTLTYDGAEWRVSGSRSGPQDVRVGEGVPFSTDDHAWSGEIRGTASAGDTIEVRVDSGLVELDIGGTPRALATSPNQSTIAAIVESADPGAPSGYSTSLRMITPEPFSVTEVALPGGAPTRLEWEPSGTLLVADAANAVHEVAPDGTVRTHALPWPALDVAPLFGDRRAVFIAVDPAANAGLSEVYVYDLDAASLVDIEPLTLTIDGMRFPSPVTGLTAMQSPYLVPRPNELGVQRRIRTVAVATANGHLQWMEEGSGCLVAEGFGPRTDYAANSAFQVDYQISDESSTAPFLEPTVESGRHVVVNPCAGFAREETWVLRYDAAISAWRVRGSVSGEQAALAYEDQRYVSDRGEISFVIRAGLRPTADDTRIEFEILPGALTVNGDNDGDTRRDVDFDLPMDPVYFEFRAGPWDGGYRQVDIRPHLVVPVPGGDLVARIKPQNGTIEFVWE